MNHRIARFVLVLLLGVTALSAADVTGIWTGQMKGRRGEVEDVAFRFKLDGSTLTGKMFGDEFDIPIEEGSVSGDQVKFVITTTNYYSGNKVRFAYTGTITAGEIELTRERMSTPGEKPPTREVPKQTFKLKRLT